MKPGAFESRENETATVTRQVDRESIAAIICTKDRYADLARFLHTFAGQEEYPEELLIIDAGTETKSPER